MATSPVVPDFKAQFKSFWQRPEGKTGILVLGGITALVVITEGQAILEWVNGMLIDTLHMLFLVGILAGILVLVTNKSFRNAVSNLFQMSMRWFTGWVVEIDPIGILENTIDRMRDNNAKMAKAIAGCNGAKVGIQAQINKNQDAIDHATSLKNQAEKMAAIEKDPLRIQRFQLDRTRDLQEIGRRMNSNKKLQQILDQTTKMYNMLTRFQNLADFNIENMQAEVDNAKQERKAIIQAYAGLGFAKKLIQGDPEQLKIMNQSLEFLATDNANKLGDMEDFARYSEKYLTQMDLEQGASADDAEKMLGKFEKHLLDAAVAKTEPVQQEQVIVSNSGKTQDYF